MTRVVVLSWIWKIDVIQAKLSVPCTDGVFWIGVYNFKQGFSWAGWMTLPDWADQKIAYADLETIDRWIENVDLADTLEDEFRVKDT